MKVSKEKNAENREALVRTAARLFRERGIDGVGVAEIGKEAGLTHGALYAHFPSKSALAGEAMAYGLGRANARMMAPLDDGSDRQLSDLLDFYLSTQRRDDIAGGCAMAASASEVGRQDEMVSARYTEGFEQLAGFVESRLGASTASKATRHQRALAIVAAMVGGVAVSRATAKSNPELADTILDAVQRVLLEIGGKPAAPRKKKTTAPRTSRSRTGP